MIKVKYVTLFFTLTLLALLSLLGGCEQQKQTSEKHKLQPVYAGTIVAVGDSLTAGQGVSENNAYPAQLERKLNEAGYNWQVINAGISGETSSGTLSRINWVLKLKPDIVILETGANDGMRGTDPAVTRKNIDETVRILKENRVLVVLAGMKMFTNLGRRYTDAFGAIYPAVANKHGLILIPFFLEGVAGDPALNQADGIHPVDEGYRIIVSKIEPYVKQTITEVERGKQGKARK